MAFADLLVRVGVEGIPAFKNAFKDAIEALETTGNRATQAGNSIQRAFSNLNVADASSKVAAEAKKLEASFNLLEKAFKDGKISADDFAKATDGLRLSLTKLANTDYTASISKLQDRLGSISASAKGFGSALSLSLTAPILAFGGAAVKAASDMESLEIGLKAVTKETGPLSVQLERLKEVAKLPGLGFKEAVQGSINLQAAGFSAGTAERALKSFGNALATVGKGRVELDGVVTALSQIASKGKVSAEEINQLAERLPQIRVAIKDAFGPGFTDATAFEKAGISAEVFVEKIITQFEKLPKAAGGFKNDLENLRDSAEQTLATFGRALLPFASSALKAVQPLIDGLQQIALEFAKLPEPIQTATVGIVALLAAVGPISYAFGSLAGGLKSLVPLLASIATAGAPAGTALGAVSTSALALTGSLVALGAAATAFAAVDTFRAAGELKDAIDTAAESSTALTKNLDQGAESFGHWGGGARGAGGAIADLKIDFGGFLKQIEAFVSYNWDHIWESINPIAAVGGAFRELTSDVELASGKFKGLEDAAKKAQQAIFDSARAQGQKAIDLYSGKTTENQVKSNVDAIFAQKAANLQELSAAEGTLKALKAMRASKEELAAATIKVTEAQRKLHPELKATGNAAGTTAKHADDLGAAMSRLVKDGGANEFKKLNEDLLTIEKGFSQNKVSLEELKSAYDTYDEKVSAVFKKQADAWNKLVHDSDKAAFDVAQSFSKAAQQLQEDYKRDLKPIEITLKLKDQIGPALFAKYEEAVKHAKDLATAFKVAGVSQASLVDQADDLAAAYKLIAADVGKIGGTTQDQADQAKIKALNARILAQRSLNGEIQNEQDELEALNAKYKAIQSTTDAYHQAGLNSINELQNEAARSAEAFARIAKDQGAGISSILTAQAQAIEDQRKVAIATGASWDHLDDQLIRVAERLKRATDLKGVSDLQAAFRNFANDAGAAVTKGFDQAFDALIKGDFKGFGSAFKSMWKDVASSAVKDFTDPLKNALSTFFGKTVRDLLKGSLSGIKEDIKDLASVVKGLFGIGTSAAGTVIQNVSGSAVPAINGTINAAGGIGGAIGGAGGGVGSAVGSAASTGFTAIAGLVTGAVSAVSGVISNFQFAGMNKSLDIIVKHTLQTANDLANLRKDAWDRAATLLSKLDDLASFTWIKLDDIVNAVRGVSITGVTAGTGGELTGIEPLVSAIRESATSIVTAIQGLSIAAGTASTTTQTVVLSSVEEMTNFLAKLTQDQTVAFEALPPEIKDAINAGKLSDLVNGQDQAIKDSLAGYLRITTELKNVRDAINSLKPATAPAASGSSAYNAATGTLDVSQIRTTISPSSAGFDITSYLGAIGAFSDRMAAYWERLFEVLAAPTGGKSATNGDANSLIDALRNTPGVSVSDAASPIASTSSTVGFTNGSTARSVNEILSSGFASAEEAKFLQTLPGYTELKNTDAARGPVGFTANNNTRALSEILASGYASEDEAKWLKTLPGYRELKDITASGPAGFQASAYVPPDYSASYVRDSRITGDAFMSPSLANSLLPTAPSLYPASTEDWKAAQMDWMRAPSTADWKPSAGGVPSGVMTVPAPQLPILVQIDGRTVAEAVANWNEKTGYR